MKTFKVTLEFTKNWKEKAYRTYEVEAGNKGLAFCRAFRMLKLDPEFSGDNSYSSLISIEEVKNV